MPGRGHVPPAQSPKGVWTADNKAALSNRAEWVNKVLICYKKRAVLSRKMQWQEMPVTAFIQRKTANWET
jgi:hypothetical protein